MLDLDLGLDARGKVGAGAGAGDRGGVGDRGGKRGSKTPAAGNSKPARKPEDEEHTSYS